MKIDILESPGIFATIQEVVTRVAFGMNVLGTIDVNATGTEATYQPFGGGNNKVRIIGTNLTVDGIALTGGEIEALEYVDVSDGAHLADITDFGLSAVQFQQKLDRAAQIQADRGLTFDQGVEKAVLFVFGRVPLTIDGSPGDDILKGGNKADVIRAGAGDDLIVASKGADTIDGGSGTNTLDASKGIGAITADLKAGTFNGATSPGQLISQITNLIASDKADTVSGDDADNLIEGNAGADILSGRGGNDIIRGGDGHDILVGNGGNDQIFGEDGRDEIDGNAGNDDLFGGNHKDTIRGGDGDDFINAGDGHDIVHGGFGRDRILGGDGEDFIRGDFVADPASPGDDILEDLGERDRIDGGRGEDTIVAQGGNDIVKAGPGKDFVSGAKGRDRIFGQGGDDVISAGQGRDTVYGGAGNDTIRGGDGDDLLTGGSGDDSFVFYKRPGNDVVTDFSAGDLLRLKRMEVTDISTFASTVSFGAGSVLLEGVDVDDLTITQSGDDVLILLG